MAATTDVMQLHTTLASVHNAASAPITDDTPQWLIDTVIVAPCILGLLWAAKECVYLSGVKMDGHASTLLKADGLGEDTAKILKVSLID